MVNGSDEPKIEVSFHLLMFVHLGGCLWCEGEGLSHCARSQVEDMRSVSQRRFALKLLNLFRKELGPH